MSLEIIIANGLLSIAEGALKAHNKAEKRKHDVRRLEAEMEHEMSKEKERELLAKLLSESIIKGSLYHEIPIKSHICDWQILMPQKSRLRCIACNEDNPHRKIDGQSNPIEAQATTPNPTFLYRYQCTGCDLSEYLFVLTFNKGTLTKIGQTPAFADPYVDDIKRYKGILKRTELDELYRAAKLYSHNLGIASFVYLRRVLEKIVHEAKSRAIQSGVEEESLNGRTIDVMKVLEKLGFLPFSSPINNKLYAVLSKGIHEYSEKECLEYFNPALYSLFTILDGIQYLNNKDEMGRNLNQIR